MRIGLYLQADRPARAARFRAAAEWWEARADGNVYLFPVFCLADMMRPAGIPEGSVEQLALFCHGLPSGFGRPGQFGVETRKARYERPEYEPVWKWAATWDGALTAGALVSLCACLCSRTPRWYMTREYGRIVSNWGPEAYRDGGLQSVAGNLACALGQHRRVRGHCAAGDTIHQALVREHTPIDGEGIGRSLFGKVMGDVKPTQKFMHEWQRQIKGPLAASYLLGIDDDLTIAEARRRMGL